MSKLALMKPRVSEKAYGLSEQLNTYTFDVPAELNKHTVARALAEQYKVTVINVRLANVPGKSKRSYRGRGRFVKGQVADIRKAYITLKEGDKLPLFKTEEQDAKPAKETK